MKKAYFKYIFAVLLFGSNGIVASFISLSSYEIVLYRTLIGSIFLILIFLLTKGKLSIFQHKLQFLYLVVSGMAMGASWMFLYEAYHRLGVSLASLTYYCGPVIIMVLSPLLFKERLAITKITGFLSVLVGIFLVNGQSAESGTNHWGLICGAMSAVTYAILVIFNKKAKDITGIENPMLQLFISFITVAAFVIYRQGFVLHITQSDMIPVLVLGILNTGIGCYFYFSSIGHLPVQTVAICGYLEPLSAVIFAMIFLKESMSVVQLIGAVLILGGAAFGELFSKRTLEGD